MPNFFDTYWSIKKLILLGMFSFSFSLAHSQNKITVTEFFEQSNLLFQQKSDSLINQLNSYDYKASLIKGVEVRTETKDFLLRRQEYVLRVKPNNISVIKNQKKQFNNRVEMLKYENELYFNADLKERYDLILDLLFTNEMIALLNTKNNYLKDKLKILNNQIYEVNFDVKDLVETEEDLQEIKLKLATFNDKKETNENVLKQYLQIEAPITFDLSSVINPDQILISQQLNKDVTEKSVELLLYETKVDILDNQLQIDKHKSKQIIDFIQTKYNGRDEWLFNETFSVGLGINLPFFGNYKQKKQLHDFNKLEMKHSYDQLIKDMNSERISKNNDFKNAKLNYTILVQQQKESSVLKLLENYKKMEGVSPLVLLELETLILDKEFEITKAKFEFYNAYINVLASNKKLFQKPFQNYLNTSL